jgi:hypothetical protein
LIKAVANAALIAVPLIALAQSNQPVTRAQVLAELVQLENSGWKPPAGSDPHYPQNIQDAEARVAAKNNAKQSGDTGYGAIKDGSSQSGRRTDATVTTYSPPVESVSH